jgi:hypothetical protein
MSGVSRNGEADTESSRSERVIFVREEFWNKLDRDREEFSELGLVRETEVFAKEEFASSTVRD